MATTGNNEFPRLSGIPSLRVDLPAIVHVAPEDELAIAIEEIAIDPQYLDVEVSGTRTVPISPLAVTVPVEEIVEEPSVVIPELPRRDDSHVRPTRSRDGSGVMSELVGKATFNKVSLPDSSRARARKQLDGRIARELGEPSFVAVIARKGGTGQTTIAMLLGMALAEARADRVLAFDAHADRGTLADRITKQTRASVDDLVARASSVQTFGDLRSFVSQDATGLDVLASGIDPSSPHVLSRGDYELVAGLAERFYSIVVSDSGSGLADTVTRATLDRAHAVVVVSGGGVEEARLGSETLTWLDANGYSELASNAVVAVNTGTQGTDLDQLEQIEAHFEARARAVARLPYDSALASGSVMHFSQLRPLTREASRELAALVIDGLAANSGS